MSGLIIRTIALKKQGSVAVRCGRGRVVDKKKDFGDSPCKVWMVGVGIEFFNLLNCILMYLTVVRTMYLFVFFLNDLCHPVSEKL